MKDSNSFIFLSYSRNQAEVVERLEGSLQARGFATWRDKRNLDHDRDFSGEIENAIRICSHVVVCLTIDVQRQDSFVRREIAYALQRKKPIIALLFPGGEMPVLIATWTYIRMNDYDLGFEELLSQLSKPPTLLAPHYNDTEEVVHYLNELHHWTSERLQESVHSLINVAASSMPDAVRGTSTSFDFDFAISPVLTPKQAANPSSSYARRTFESFEEAFDHFGGRLLLLGEPGAGKTTTLLAFARNAALERLHDPTKPIPVLENLHRWDGTTNIKEWILTRPRMDCLAHRNLLYLLDGLDELSPQRGSVTSRTIINQATGDRSALQVDIRVLFMTRFLREIKEPVVVTSRLDDYRKLSTKISLPGAVALQPLDEKQIYSYLKQRNLLGLWTTLQTDSPLLRMAQIPLLLALLTVAFSQHEVPTAIRNRSDIFDRYIVSRFLHELSKPMNIPFDEEFTRLALSELAAYMHLRPSSTDIELSYDEVENILGDYAKPFSDFACRMHFLQRTRENNLAFIHLELRDFCAESELIRIARTHASSMKRLEASHVISRIATESSLASLLEMVNDPLLDYYALLALQKIGGPAGLPGLVKGLKSSQSRTRRVAVQALHTLADPASVPNLLEALDDTDAYVQIYALEALRNLGSITEAALIKPLSDTNKDVRLAAAKALGDLRERDSLPALIERLRVEFDYEVYATLIFAIGETATTSVPHAVIKALTARNLQIRFAAVEAVGKVGDITAIPFLKIPLLDDPVKEVREMAAIALGCIGGSESTQLLKQALDDAFWSVRNSAEQALRKIGSDEAQYVLQNWVNWEG